MIELLLALLLQATGIPREVDPALVQMAEERVSEVSCGTDDCFDHDLRRAGTFEVLHWNQYALTSGLTPEAYAVQAWLNSPEHHHILSDPGLTRIGCAHTSAFEREYFVCVLTSASGPLAEGTGPGSSLPNTAAPPEFRTLGAALLGAGILMLGYLIVRRH